MARHTKSNPKPPLTPEQQQLAEQHLPLARMLSIPLCRTWPGSSEEYQSAAIFALVEAAGSFDPTREVKFTTYARNRIKGALIDTQRREVRNLLIVDHDRVASAGTTGRQGVDQDRLVNFEPDRPVGWYFEAHEEIETRLRRLPDQYAHVLRLLYLEGLSQAEAAAKLGCSSSRLSALHRQGLAMISGGWGRYRSRANSQRRESRRRWRHDHPEARRDGERVPGSRGESAQSS